MKTFIKHRLMAPDNTPGAAQGGGTGPTNPAPPQNTHPANAVPGNAAPQNQTDWTTNLPDDFKNYVQTKGFKDPHAVLDSYRNLEKLMGAPKERLLTLPENDDVEAWKPIYDRLGRPAKPEEYNFKLPEEAGGEKLTGFLRSQFHELGLSKKQGEELMKRYQDHFTNEVKDIETQMQANLDNDQKALQKEWGAAHQQNLNIAAKAAQAFGLEAETIDKLEAAMGYSGVMKFLHNVGARLGEGKFEGPRNGGGGNGVLSPEQAQAKIRELNTDASYRQKLLDGDVKIKAEWDRLHAQAYPEQN